MGAPMRKLTVLLLCAAMMPGRAAAGQLDISLSSTDLHFSKSAATGPITSDDPGFKGGFNFPLGSPVDGGFAGANYGQLKVGTIADTIDGPVISQNVGTQVATARFADSALFAAPPVVSGGFLTFSFTIDGTEYGDASDIGESAGEFRFDLSISQNGSEIGSFSASRDRLTVGPLSLDSPFDNFSVQRNGQNVAIQSAADLFATWTVTVPFVAADGALSFDAFAKCRSHYGFGVPINPSDGSKCDATHTITWGGVVASLNQNGQAFTGLSLIGSNGFNYALGFGQQPAPAPEPAALALFGLGLAGVGLRRRYRLAR